jgi:hypothetical protein
MILPHPTLEQQIEAVQWAEIHASVIAATARRKGYDHAIPAEYRRRLEAALETLRMLEFGREVLN